MAEELYFQWQNDALRTTIYPRREAMLTNFLVYYKEIDLWAEYQKKDISSKVKEYHARRKQAVENAVRAYYDYRNYFMMEDIRADYQKKFGKLDEEALEKIHAFHKTFKTYIPRFTNPRSETYFVSQQVLYWLQALKDYKARVASKQRRVFVMKSQEPPHPNVPKEVAELASMEKIALPMLDEEYRRLNEFVTASSKIEKRKIELAKTVQDAVRKSDEANRKLSGLKPEIERQETLQKKSSDELARLKSPPDLASLESYFSNPDVSAQIRARYPKASDDFIKRLGEYRKSLRDQLSYSKSISSRRNAVRNVLWNVSQYQKSIEKEILKHDNDLRNMGPTWKHKAEREALRDNLRDVSQVAIAEEVEHLAGFQAALEHADRSKEETGRLIAAEEKELAGINARLSQLRKDAQTLQAELDLYDDILIVTEEKRLTEYVPDPSQPVTPKEIVQLELDEYKASLAKKDHYQLLELVVERFKSQPGRYPKWLQYMVVHFSGMRYASAHGSWADPKDLLANLRILSIDKELKGMDEDAVEAFCREKLESYEPNGSTPTGGVGARSPLSKTRDPEWKERVEGHVKRIRRAIEIDSASHQRSALANLRTDESNYEIDLLEPAEVYEQLIAYKDELPDWMWKEIVKLTDLRLTEVTDRNWEKPSNDPQQYSRKDAELRKVLNDWKNKFVTGWREEHDRSDKLIVTRAVCNEVAEHIQHLRGHSPDGGLTAKPKWYQRLENSNPQAYLVKPEDADDLKAGASLLWLRFVRKEPNPWQVAQHITTKKGGHSLLPAAFPRKDSRDSKSTWSYNRGGPITRTRFVTGEKGGSVRQMEWLRWIHEATVVEVADTAEGRIVLTFETALPSDDPRLSAIGVFKHRLDNLLSDGDEDYYNRSFVGYVPEGELPMENLKDMLDWDKVLHRPKGIPQ